MASPTRSGAVEGTGRFISLNRPNGQAQQLLHQLAAHLISRYSAPGAEQNLPADHPYRGQWPRPYALTNIDDLFPLVFIHELTSLPPELQEISTTPVVRDFLFARLRRLWKQPAFYALAVLHGTPPRLLHDDLLDLCRDLWEVPHTPAAWIELAHFMALLIEPNTRFASVKLLYQYRHRLFPKDWLKQVPTIWLTDQLGSFGRRHALAGSYHKSTIKALPRLLNHHPEWTSDQCWDMLELLEAMSDYSTDHRYLIRLIEQRYLAVRKIVFDRFRTLNIEITGYSCLHQDAFIRYAIQGFPANRFVDKKANAAWLADFQLRCERVLPIVWCNHAELGSDVMLGLLNGKSIRDLTNFRPGKQLIRLFHNHPPEMFPYGCNFWSALVLRNMGCPTELLERLHQDYNLQRLRKNQTHWWKDARTHTYIQRLIDWKLSPADPRYDYLRHAYRYENLDLRRATLASVTRRSRDWHDAFLHQQEQLRITRESRNLPKSTFSWTRVEIHDWKLKDIRIVQLTTLTSLQNESQTLAHCVAAYASLCKRKVCSIHTMQVREDKQWVSKVTIEVRDKLIVQARGYRNRSLTADEQTSLALWANQASLTINSGVCRE